MTERITEQIRYQTELLRLTWITLIGAVGGSIGLLLGELTVMRMILASAGFLITVALLGAGWHLDSRIRHDLNRLGGNP